MNPAGRVVHALGRPLLQVALGTFYKRIAVTREEPFPESCPVVVASNHPNGLFDPFLVGLATPRRVHFLARSGVFGMPVVGALLRTCGVLPVYRRQDDPAQMDRNEAMFAACAQVLDGGGVVGIFPEGRSHGEREVKPLRTGAARIALGSRGARIVPAGIVYAHRARFRSRVHLRLGRAIDAERYRDDPDGVRRLTDDLEAELERLALHLPRPEVSPLAAQVEALFIDEAYQVLGEEKTLAGPPPKLPHPGAEAIPADAVEHAREIGLVLGWHAERDAAALEAFRREIEAYGAERDRRGLREEALRRFHRRGWGWLAVRTVLAGALGLPISVAGVVASFVPYRLARWAGEGIADSPQDVAAWKIFFAAVGFGLWYGAIAAGIGLGLGWILGVAALLALPYAGLFAFHYIRRMEGYEALWRAAASSIFMPRRMARLLARRRQVIEAYDRLKAAARETLAAAPPAR